MSYAAVITHVQSQAEAAPRLVCAVEMARRFDATLLGVASEATPPIAFAGGFDTLEADWSTALGDSIEAHLTTAHRTFSAAAASLGRRARLLSDHQLPIAAVTSAARAADLIVAGGAPRETQSSFGYCAPADLVLRSGRPVLIAPPNAAPLAAETILFAWKDSREARRAMADALPFFRQAQRVIVVTFCSTDDATQARIAVEGAAQALVDRGINAEAKVVEPVRADGFQILRAASAQSADLVVCGAYGHSRLGEWAFGGVTDDLLSQDEVYLLLSH